MESQSLVAPYRPHPILRWFYDRFFSHICGEGHWSRAVEEAAARGVVVYVMRSVSLLDFLCLDYLVKRFSLPLVRFVNDLGLWILEPFGKGERRLRLTRQIPEDTALTDTVEAQHSALLFLRRRPALGKPRRKGRDLDVDLIRTLVETQRHLTRPILLVPQTFVWTKLPPNRERTFLDLLFGPREWPGRLRVVLRFLFNYRNALLRSGEPIDLKAFADNHQDLTDSQVADKIRYALLRIMERERAVILGPAAKTPGRIREELLRSPRVRAQIAHHARTNKLSTTQATKYARTELKRLCSAQDPYVLRLLHRILDAVWHRIYDGIEVDADGIERVRVAARDSTLVFLPSHKSHVDYLVLSDVLYANALSPPLIAGGDNLNIWPIGGVLRRAGAFFIRRSFKGKRLYAALVEAYLRKLLLEGFNVEFFIEGGRSRTGMMLAPKLGLLSMVIDGALLLPSREVRFVPISVSYERIIEERSYVHEAGGAEKKAENLGSLLRTPRVLRSRYGRLYVQFGEILSFNDLRREIMEGRSDTTGHNDGRHDPGEPLSPPERRVLVRRVAHRAIYEINRVTVVTPAALVAMVLLVHRKRGMTHVELMQRANALICTLRTMDARFAGSLCNEDGKARAETVREAVRLFSDGKLITCHGEGDSTIYAVPEERRMALEYYKNNLLHFFVPRALISAALRNSQTEPVSEEGLRGRVRQLSRLLKHEFAYRADATFDEIFDDALTAMLDAGELERMADHLVPANSTRGRMVPLFADMLRTHFETYRLALRGAELLADSSMGRKEWIKATMAQGQHLYLAGELELRESLSKPRLENALRALRDLGLVRFQDDMLSLGEAVDGAGTLRRLGNRLGSTPV